MSERTRGIVAIISRGDVVCNSTQRELPENNKENDATLDPCLSFDGFHLIHHSHAMPFFTKPSSKLA